MGYRFYVDSLIEAYKTTSDELAALKKAINIKQRKLENILSSAIKVASSVSNYTAFAMKPDLAGVRVRRYDFVYLDDFDSVLVMVMPSGLVKTRNVVSRRPVPQSELKKFSGVLNEHLSGYDATQVRLEDIMEMESEMGEYDFIVSPIVKTIYEELSSESSDLKVEGLNKFLSYPDYYDKDRLEEILEMFEKKKDFVEAISTEEARSVNDDSDKVKVYIGSENIVKVIDNSTLIFKPVRKEGRIMGAIGIVGPTRMNYKKVISTIDTLSRGVTELLQAPPGKNDDSDDNTSNGGKTET